MSTPFNLISILNKILILATTSPIGTALSNIVVIQSIKAFTFTLTPKTGFKFVK